MYSMPPIIARFFENWIICVLCRLGIAAQNVRKRCIDRDGQLEHNGAIYTVGEGAGDVPLLPAVVGACVCRQRGAVSLLEVAPNAE